MRVAISLACLLLFLLAQPTPGLPPDPVIDYDRDVKPILAGSCLQCHGADKPKNGLRVDRRSSLLKGGDSGEPAMVPGKPAASFLLKLVRGEHEHLVMPPKGDRLKREQIEVLERWIASGAKMPDDSALALEELPWSLRPVQRPAVPKIASDWIANPIDAFVLRALLDKGLEPGKQADPRTLIRRAYLDVTGLLPSPEEVEVFVKDQAADRYPRLIDKLLASPRYGERWAQHWLDVVRYGDTDGFEVNTPRPNAWPYRDWVIKSLNDDKPYDRFVMEQIAEMC